MIDATQLYFAYGSNLNRGDMGRRCPAARPHVAARLDGWRLTFRGVADIERTAGGAVPGALWWLSDDDACSLDVYEGAPSLYRRRIVEVATPEGRCEAMTYMMTEASYLGLPSPGYLRSIESGYRDWGLRLEPLERAVRETRIRLERLGISGYRPDGRKRLRAVFDPRPAPTAGER